MACVALAVDQRAFLNPAPKCTHVRIGTRLIIRIAHRRSWLRARSSHLEMQNYLSMNRNDRHILIAFQVSSYHRSSTSAATALEYSTLKGKTEKAKAAKRHIAIIWFTSPTTCDTESAGSMCADTRHNQPPPVQPKSQPSFSPMFKLNIFIHDSAHHPLTTRTGCVSDHHDYKLTR